MALVVAVTILYTKIKSINNEVQEAHRFVVYDKV